MNRRDAMKVGAAGLAVLTWPDRLRAQEAIWEKTLFVMDTWFWQSEKEFDPPAQAALLKKLGFGGMALSWGARHAERLAALKASALETPGCYVVVDIDGGYPPHLAATIALLKGTAGIPWVSLSSKKHVKSDPSGDEAALAILNRCADECKAAGVAALALYPHVGSWLEKMGDALRLVKKADRLEVGLQFNLYHWMAADRGEELQKTLESAAPHLKGVSINGSGIRASILPLGEGEYDVTPVLKELSALGYKGPISHQGYSIKGKIPERLAAAKEAWEKMKARLKEK